MKDNIIDIMARITCILGSLLAICAVVYGISIFTSDTHTTDDTTSTTDTSTAVDSYNTESTPSESAAVYANTMFSIAPEDWAEIVTQNSQKEPDSSTAQVLLKVGKIPSWNMLREFGILYVYDENGNMYEPLKGTAISKLVPLLEMLCSSVYVDAVCSGRYVAVDDQLFIVFNSGRVSEVSLNSAGIYDTIGIDRETGIIHNVAGEDPNPSMISVPQ